MRAGCEAFLRGKVGTLNAEAGLFRAARLSRQLNGDGLATAPRLGHLDPDSLAGLKLLDSGATQDGHMDEDILAAIVKRDKALVVRCTA